MMYGMVPRGATDLGWFRDISLLFCRLRTMFYSPSISRVFNVDMRASGARTNITERFIPKRIYYKRYRVQRSIEHFHCEVLQAFLYNTISYSESKRQGIRPHLQGWRQGSAHFIVPLDNLFLYVLD